MGAAQDKPVIASGRIRAAFFDLDDTLCDDTSAWIACSRKSAESARTHDSDVDTAELARAFLEISHAYWFGEESTRETKPVFEVRVEQWRQALAAQGREPSRVLAEQLAEDYGKRRSRDIDLFPDAVSTLSALRDRGICVAIVSNGFTATHVTKVANLGLNAHVDHVILAEEVGHFKPDARIFRHALDLCNCSPSEAIMVGDDLENDIAGAEAAGIRSYWFNPHGRLLLADSPTPTGGRISALSEILSKIA